MSRFDSVHQAQYVERIRRFLRLPKRGFLRRAGLVASDHRVGKAPAYPLAAVRALEEAANHKAVRCEADDTTFGERLRLARDYAMLGNADIARAVRVSRELVRRWCTGLSQPRQPMVDALATLLDVPSVWLLMGGKEHLPASSHLGLRFGEESQWCRECLYSATVLALAELHDGADGLAVSKFVAEWLAANGEISSLARRAGGQWQKAGKMVFVPRGADASRSGASPLAR